jgi:hypothetical protein
VPSLINFSLYHQDYHPMIYPAITGFIFITVILFFLIHKKERNSFFILALLLLIILLNIIQHFLFGSPYIMERFALFITPLYLLLLIHLMNYLIERNKAFMLSGFVLLALITGGMSYHFSRCANISYALNWDYDADTKQMLIDLEKEKTAAGKQNMSLGVTWLFEPTINFYRETKKIHWLGKVTREETPGEHDFYYVTKEDLMIVPPGKSIIKEYPVSKARLMK